MSSHTGAKRQLTDLHVQFISLVDKPANGKGVVLKNADAVATIFEIVKTDSDMMRVYGIVYSPGEVDSQGDTADAITIRRAADEYMREGRAEQVDVNHSYVEDTAYVAESWLIRKGDPLFASEKDGAWAVGIQITDPALWQRMQDGELTGLSLAGVARAREATPETQTRFTEKQAESLFTRMIKKFITPEDDDMKDTEIAQLVQTEVAKALAAADTGNTGTPSKPQGDVAVTKADIETQVQKSVDAALGDALQSAVTTTVETAVAKAFAAGQTETGGAATAEQENFL